MQKNIKILSIQLKEFLPLYTYVNTTYIKVAH